MYNQTRLNFLTDGFKYTFKKKKKKGGGIRHVWQIRYSNSHEIEWQKRKFTVD